MATVEFECIVKQGNKYKVFCQDFRACKVFNKKYPTYKNEKETGPFIFKEGDEAIFYILEKDYYFALKTLKTYKCLT